MKILLLGEFSGLHKNLKEGLVELGHDVDIASSGDGWKNIEGDIYFGSNRSGYVRKVERFVNIFKALPKFKNYDVVQFISPILFPQSFGVNNFIVNYIFKHNYKVFLVGAGATPQNTAIADFYENRFKYPELYSEIVKKTPILWSQTEAGRNYNRWFLKKINGYIPIMYEYAQGYRDIKYDKICPTLPIPINIDKIIYEDNVIEDKLIIFHGLNREGVKGTPLIREALKRLQDAYPNEVECIIDGRMPLEEYLLLLRKTNVVIDQVYTASIGMNGVYNLAMGKIVIGGGEPEFLEEFSLKESPLIPIQANIDSIYNQLEYIVKNRKIVFEKGKASRRFAEELHDYKKVAKQYLEVWKEF